MTAISNNDIARAIYLSTKDKTGTELKDGLRNVTKFLARRRLISKNKEILSSLDSIINKEEGVVVAKVSSVEKISHKTKEDLTHLLKKRYKALHVTLEESLDPRLLGGLRIEVNNEVMDLSIKNKIVQLQTYLAKE